jgi:hypothetical protein
MGFKIEGTFRWMFVMEEGKVGVQDPRPGDPNQMPGRGSVFLAVCWDDWEGGVREKVQELLKRK